MREFGEPIEVRTHANELISCKAMVVRGADIGVASDLGQTGILVIVSKSVPWTPRPHRDHVTLEDGKRYLVNRIENEDSGAWELFCSP